MMRADRDCGFFSHAPGFLHVVIVSETLFLCFTDAFQKPGLEKQRKKKGQKKEEAATPGAKASAIARWWL